MRDVAIVSFAQAPNVRREADRNEVEMLMPVVKEAIEASGIPRKSLDFTVSGSCDYVAGQPFAFVSGIDAVGPWPPINESHVEMDGAFALYEAWVKIQTGQADSALVYAFGKASMGDIAEVLTLQLDPYYLAPLWPDAVSVAALEARVLLERGHATLRDLAEVVVRNLRSAKDNPFALVKGDFEVEKLLAAPFVQSPLREHDCPPVTDGAAAVVLAAGDLARKACRRPAFIRGIDHRIEAHALGARNLGRSRSTEIAGEKAGAFAFAVDVAELHAPFSHQELILREALRLDPGKTQINPSGGALAANPVMVAGLLRLGEAARRIHDGSARRALAHATSGPCLQQNLVCILECP